MTEHYLKGAKWRLKNDTFDYDGELDENGCADLKNIAVGQYTFTLSKAGYLKRTEQLTVDGSPLNIIAELEPIPKEETTKKTTKKTAKKTTKKSTKKSSTSKEETTTKQSKPEESDEKK